MKDNIKRYQRMKLRLESKWDELAQLDSAKQASRKLKRMHALCYTYMLLAAIEQNDMHTAIFAVDEIRRANYRSEFLLYPHTDKYLEHEYTCDYATLPYFSDIWGY